jgi:hypothetical protein
MSINNILKINCLGLHLSRLTEEDIELVRNMRNRLDIKKRMSYQKNITSEQQVSWYKSINNEFNYYFLITYNQKKIGLINAKNLNPKTSIGEGGIFIWEKEYLDSPIPVLASIVFLDVIFNYFKISNKSLIRVLKKNKKAIAYNEALGYIPIEIPNTSKVSFLILTKEDFNIKLEKFRKALSLFFKNTYKITITGMPNLLNHQKINEYLEAQVQQGNSLF